MTEQFVYMVVIFGVIASFLSACGFLFYGFLFYEKFNKTRNRHVDDYLKRKRRSAKKINNKRRVTVNNTQYTVILHPEVDGFWVECPELHGCDSQGDTIEESLEMIKDAIRWHLEVTKEAKI